MRHRLSGNKLSRPTGHRKSMLRGMVTALIQNESLQTTEAKAREAGRLTEKMITLGKRGTLHARRRAHSYLRDDSAVSKLFGALAERYKERSGGYTRVVKAGFRYGDNAPMAVIELGDRDPDAKGAEDKARHALEAEADGPREPT